MRAFCAASDPRHRALSGRRIGVTGNRVATDSTLKTIRYATGVSLPLT